MDEVPGTERPEDVVLSAGGGGGILFKMDKQGWEERRIGSVEVWVLGLKGATRSAELGDSVNRSSTLNVDDAERAGTM